MIELPEGCLEGKPNNHHDFQPPPKGTKQVCTRCDEAKEAHTIYERVKIVGMHGSRFAWRLKESK